MSQISANALRLGLLARATKLVLGSVCAFAISACARVTPLTEPIPVIDQMCCKAANEEMTEFGGCREDRRHCTDDEPIWIRGAVTCTEHRPAECLGGRCCKYRRRYGSADAILTWEPPSSAQEPTTSESPEATSQDPAPVESPEGAPSESVSAAPTPQ